MDVKGIRKFQEVNNFLTGKLACTFASMVTKFSLNSSYLPHPGELQMGKCVMLLTHLRPTTIIQSVQGGRWFHQKVLTAESWRRATAVSISLPILKPWCPKTNILPKETPSK